MDSSDWRVLEAETARQKFVKESQIKFADQDFLEGEGEEDSQSNDESSLDESDD